MKESKEIYEITAKSEYILGDLNLNQRDENDDKKLQVICGENKILHLNQITSVRGNQPDHIIVIRDRRFSVHSSSFLNFASDHKSIVMRVSQYINDKVIENVYKPQKSNATSTKNSEEIA